MKARMMRTSTGAFASAMDKNEPTFLKSSSSMPAGLHKRVSLGTLTPNYSQGGSFGGLGGTTCASSTPRILYGS